VTRAVMRPTGVKSCPRCAYVGEGIDYFRRPGHCALLVGVSLFTYGLGGLAYWLARRKHRVCPQCGLGWMHASMLDQGGRVPVPRIAGIAVESEEPLPRSGVGRRAIGVAMAALAAIMISVGFIEFEFVAVAIGSVIGAGGTATFWWGMKAKQEVDRVLAARTQRRVLMLATEKGGVLTVTDVAASLNMSLDRAEELMNSMDDGFRVRSDITEQGIIVYEFPEVLHRPSLDFPVRPQLDSGANA
jgi:nitrogen fixation-related uncharacterized protein